MKNKFFTFFLIFIISSAYPQTNFYKTYNNSNFFDIYEYSADSYILCGNKREKYWMPAVYKLDKSGNIVKELVFDNYFNGTLFKIYPPSDKFMYVVGNSYDSIIFTKVDTSLNIIWKKDFKFQRDSDKLYVFSPPLLDQDSNIIFPGYKYPGMYITSTPKLFLYKFSLSGDSLDYKIYDSVFPQSNFITNSCNIFQSPFSDNYYINITNTLNNSYLIRIKNNFALDTILPYVNSESPTHPYTYCVNSLFTKKDNFISILTEGDFDSDNSNIAVLLLDTNFEILKTTHIINDSVNLNTLNSNVFSVFGNGKLYVMSSSMQLTCIDSATLEILWSKDFSYITANSVSNIILTSDNGLFISVTDFVSHISTLLKTDSLGNITIIDGYKDTLQNLFSVFPNPANNYIKITLNPDLIKAKFQLFDLNGRLKLSKILNDKTSKINTSFLPQGIYFYKISTDKKTQISGKLILY